jgi:acyl carrier protein
MLNNFQKHLRNKYRFNPFRHFRINSQRCLFATAAEKLPTLEGKPSDQKNVAATNSVQPWVEVENRLAKLRGELVLADEGRIEKYVLGVIKGYFRTTYKEGLGLESKLSDHGLDSLDSIEIGMILEDELGYIIEAETLPQFTKVKHFVNYIKQIEAYKKEHIILPQVRVQESEESWDSWIPYGEKLKSKLFKMTTDKNTKKGEGHH